MVAVASEHLVDHYQTLRAKHGARAVVPKSAVTGPGSCGSLSARRRIHLIAFHKSRRMFSHRFSRSCPYVGASPGVVLERPTTSTRTVVRRSTKHRIDVSRVPSCSSSLSALSTARPRNRRRRSSRTSDFCAGEEAPAPASGGKTQPAVSPSNTRPAPAKPVEFRLGEPRNVLEQEEPDCGSEAWFTDAESEAESLKSTTIGVARSASCLRVRELPLRKLSVNWEVAAGRRKSTTAIVEQVAIETTAPGTSRSGEEEDPSEVLTRPDLPNCPFKILCRIGSKIRDVASKHRERSASISHISLPDDLVRRGNPTSERTRAETGYTSFSERTTKRASRSRLWAFTSPRSDRRRMAGPGPSRKDSGYASNSSKSPITPPSSPLTENGRHSSRILSFSTEASLPKAVMKLPPTRSDSLRSIHSLAGVVSTDVAPELKARYALRKFIAHEMTTKESNYARNLRELAEVFQGPLAEASARAASVIIRQQARRSSVKCPGGCPSRCLCKYLHIGCSPVSAESTVAFRSAPSLSSPGQQTADFGPKSLPPALPTTSSALSSVDSGLKNPRAMPEWVNKLHATSMELAGDLKEVYRYWAHADSSVGEVFLKHLQADRFNVYLRYCRDYQSVIDALGRLSKSSFILKNMDGSPENNRLALKSYLILPIQQLGRYPLWLHDLVKATPEDHPDHPGLVEAERQMRELASVANSWVDGGRVGK